MDDLPFREMEIELFGGRYDGKKFYGVQAARLLRKIATQGGTVNGYTMCQECEIEDKIIRVRMYAIP